MAKLFRMMVLSRFVSQKMVLLNQHRKKEDIDEMGNFLADGKVTPVIDRTYPLAETVDALRYLEAGHARGKVVITI
jgi:NADPH:quinone reductase-like Zn-dependent oxidoreductase